MNDCVFNYICCCKCNNGKCGKYISINSGEGSKIEKDYSEEINPLIEKALEPVRNKIINKYNLKEGQENE